MHEQRRGYRQRGANYQLFINGLVSHKLCSAHAQQYNYDVKNVSFGDDIFGVVVTIAAHA